MHSNQNYTVWKSESYCYKEVKGRNFDPDDLGLSLSCSTSFVLAVFLGKRGPALLSGKACNS